jgi:hypothetical protein
MFDYRRLLKEFQSRGALLRAFYYTAIIEDPEYTSIRPLVDWLDYNGYTVVTKPTKEFVEAGGRRKVKGNMSVELAVHAMELAGHIDRMFLFLGRWRLPPAAESGAAPRRARHRRFHPDQPAANGGRRFAASGRRLHRSCGIEGNDRPRSVGAAGPRELAPAIAAIRRTRDDQWKWPRGVISD